MSSDNIIILCRCVHYELVEQNKLLQICRAVKESGQMHAVVDDLCGLAVSHGSQLHEIVKHENITVVACYPRAVKALFTAAGIDISKGFSILNMRELTAAEIESELLSRAVNGATESIEIKENSNSWVPWFPVIDSDRCNNCGLCAEFCLFDVFDRADGRIQVVRPANCKTNCPACARICPRAAIMFPKFRESPVNGAEIDDVDEARARIKVDMEKLFEGDVYEKLAARREKNRKSILSFDAGKALEERESCAREHKDNGAQ